MADAKRGVSIEPKLSWHFFNALTCTGVWFLAFVFSISVVLALTRALGMTEGIFLVPTFLILILNVGATLLASIRSSRRTMMDRPEAQQLVGPGATPTFKGEE